MCDSVPSARYSSVCNVLLLWNIQTLIYIYIYNSANVQGLCQLLCSNFLHLWNLIIQQSMDGDAKTCKTKVIIII